MLLEIACFNTESCLIAQRAGAHRIEFCEDHSSGGITPTRENILQVRKMIQIPLHVIIRPRSGNFIYNNLELQQMKQDILFCRENLIDGVVLGILNDKYEVEVAAAQELLSLCGTMSKTFHRAIDECADLFQATEKLIPLGFHRILTSGGNGKAIDHIPTLTELQLKFSHRIKIMPGGGVRSSNLASLKATKCDEFHSAAITNNGQIPDEKEIRELLHVLKDF